MFGLTAIPSLAKYIGIALVVLFLGSLSYFAVHTYTSTVKQNGQLEVVNTTLKADSAMASSATIVAVKKLDQLDTIIIKKANNETAIRNSSTAFVEQHHVLSLGSGAVRDWSSTAVPSDVVELLCQHTSVDSPDCHRSADSANPASTDAAN